MKWGVASTGWVESSGVALLTLRAGGRVPHPSRNFYRKTGTATPACSTSASAARQARVMMRKERELVAGPCPS